jgi:hypothetical protein
MTADNLNMRRTHGEQGVVTAWLVQVLVAVAVIGVILFDAGSIAWNYFGVDSRAQEIALEVAETARSARVNNPAMLQQVARRLARRAGARVVGQIQITQDTIEITIRREADTMLVGRIGPVADWAKASATGSASTS